ncbi:MAG: hypothetical protein JW940_06645 [Polyangiaceae bacterium]|nr:hypothetical protein [Polyangiaceae bacterium]
MASSELTPLPLPAPPLTLPSRTNRCEFEASRTLAVTRRDDTRELWDFGNRQTLVRREAGHAPGSADPKASEPPIVFEPEGMLGTSYRYAAVGIRDLAPDRRARLLPWARRMGFEVAEGERIWIRDTEEVKLVLSADLRLAVALDAVRDLGRATGLVLDTGKTWTVHAWHSTVSRLTHALQSRFLPRPTPNAERLLLTNAYPIGRDAWTQTRLVAGDSGRTVAEIVPALAALSRHGRFVVAMDLGWELSIHDAAEGQLRFRVPEGGWLESIAWSEDDWALAVGCRLYASSTGTPIFRPANAPVERRDLSFAAEGRTLVELRADGLVAWDLERGARVRLLDDVMPQSAKLSLDAAERRAAVASARGVTVVDLVDPRPVATIVAPWHEDKTHAFPPLPRAVVVELNDAGTELAITDGGRLLIHALPPPGSGPWDGPKSAAMSVRLPGRALPAGVAWSSDGAWLAVARRRQPETYRGPLEVALISRGVGLRVERTLSLGTTSWDDPTVGIAFRPDTSTVGIAIVGEPPVALYEAKTGRRIAQRSEGLGGAQIGWSRDGSTLFAKGINGVLALSPDLATVVATIGDGVQSVREAARRGPAPAGSRSRPLHASNPSGTLVAVHGEDGELRLERADGAVLRLADYRLEGREGALVVDAAGHWDGSLEAGKWLVWQRDRLPTRPAPSSAELLAVRRPDLLRTFVKGG